MSDSDSVKAELEGVYNAFLQALKEKDLDALLSVVRFSDDEGQALSERETLEANLDSYTDWMLTLSPELSATRFITVKSSGRALAGYCFVWSPAERTPYEWFMKTRGQRGARASSSRRSGSLLFMRTFEKIGGRWQMPFYELTDPDGGEPMPDTESDGDLETAARDLVDTDISFELWRPEGKHHTVARKLTVLALSAVPLVLSLLFTLAAYKDLQMARETASWESAEGTISKLDSKGNLAYEYSSRWDAHSSEYLDYSEYVGNRDREATPAASEGVDHSEYVGNWDQDTESAGGGRIWLGFLHRFVSPLPGKAPDATQIETESSRRQGKERALKVAENYTEGDRVQVYYDPDNPAAAVLVPYSEETHWGEDYFKLWFYVGIGISVLSAIAFLPSPLKPVAVVVCFAAILFYLFVPRQPSDAPPGAAPEEYSKEGSVSWPQTEGTVFLSFSSRYWYRGWRLAPKVIYKYQVDGVTHSAFVVADGVSDSSEEFVSRHPEGEIVEVYYDPGNPANSTLSPR